MSGLRRQGREKALQLLMSLEGAMANGETSSEKVAADFWDAAGGSPSLRRFTNELFFGAAKVRELLDPVIIPALKNWRLERLSPVDRNLLRLAVYELRHCPEVPPKVVLNEYIEIAKKFGEGGSGGLVNGVLDTIYKAGTAPAETVG